MDFNLALISCLIFFWNQDNIFMHHDRVRRKKREVEMQNGFESILKEVSEGKNWKDI
jgi:hypothetical protein